MKSALCWLALGAFPGLGQAGGGYTAPFAIYTQFEREPSRAVLESMRQELAALTSPAGLLLEWRAVEAHPDGEVFADLATVRFTGRCDLSVLVAPASGGGLGRTNVSQKRILPFTEVDCDQIRRFLSGSLLRFYPDDREKIFGRAIGRVLAHELFHIFTNRRDHGVSGVAGAVCSPADLIADDFRFNTADLRLLGARLLRRRSNDSAAGPGSAGESLFLEKGCVYCHGVRREGTARGPSLASRIFGREQLSARLAAKRSPMYRRARKEKAVWPPLIEAELVSLAAYLNRPVD